MKRDIIGRFRRLFLFFAGNWLARLVLCITWPVRKSRISRFRAIQGAPEEIVIAFFARGLGDCIYFAGILKLIRERFPTSTIKLATLFQWEMFFKQIPFVDEVFPCPDYFGKGLRSLVEYLKSAGSLKLSRSADLYLELYPTMDAVPAYWSLFVPKLFSIGIGELPKRMLFDQPVPIEWRKPFYEVILDGLALLGIKMPADGPSFWTPPDADLERFSGQLGNERKYIVIAPGGKRNVEAPKDFCWSFDGFPEVVNRLISLGYPIILSGASYDLEQSRSFGESSRLMNLTGKTTIQELFTIVKRYARLVVCNNSGLLHVASVQGIPTVSYADPQENMLRWGPYPDDGRHVALQDRPGKRVTAAEFLEAILKKLLKDSDYASTEAPDNSTAASV